jgi:hypothetical protein
MFCALNILLIFLRKVYEQFKSCSTGVDLPPSLQQAPESVNTCHIYLFFIIFPSSLFLTY